MTNYRAGVALEYEIKALFEGAGWIVQRSAGSHGRWDLIALKAGRRKKQVFIALLQAKSGAACLSEEP